MKAWFQRQYDEHEVNFNRLPSMCYFIDVAKMEVLAVLEHEIDQLSDVWAFVGDDDRSSLPKLTRKGDQ